MFRTDIILLVLYMVGLLGYLIYARNKPVNHRLKVAFLSTMIIPCVMTRGWIFWPVLDIFQYAHGIGVFFVPCFVVIAITEGIGHLTDTNMLGEKDLSYSYLWFIAAVLSVAVSVYLWLTLFK